MESVRVQLEEESEARLELERQLVKASSEIQIWRSKYETEAAARAEEVLFITKQNYVLFCCWKNVKIKKNHLKNQYK